MTEPTGETPAARPDADAQAGPKAAPRSVEPARPQPVSQLPLRLAQISAGLTGLAVNGVVVASLLLGTPDAPHGVTRDTPRSDDRSSERTHLSIPATKVRTFDIPAAVAPKPASPAPATTTFAPPSTPPNKPIVIKAPSPAPAAPPPAATPAADPPAVTPPASSPPPEAPAATPQPQAAEPSPVAPATWTDTEVATAVAACTTLLGPLKATYDAKPAVRAGQCGTPAPIALRAVGTEAIAVEPPALMNCAIAAAIHTWVSDTLQPAAREVLGSPVVKLIGTSSYVCRNRNGQAQGPISEHAFANAFDISGVVLADGRTISVLEGWGPVKESKAGKPSFGIAAVVPPMRRSPPLSPELVQGLGGPKAKAAEPAPATPTAPATTTPQPPASAFLKRIHAGACKTFSTVLGPDANAYHRNHLHFDLKPRKSQTICQ